MVHSLKLGYLTLATNQLENMVDFYTKVMGLSITSVEKDGTTYLSTGIDHHNLILQPSTEEKGLVNYGLQIENKYSLTELTEQLKEMGVSAQLVKKSSVGIEEYIIVKDNEGKPVHLFQNMHTASKGITGVGVSPNKLGHLAQWVKDPQQTVDFYENTLDFRVSDWMKDFFVFMRCNQDHHSLNFIKTDGDKSSNRLHHLAFELRDWGHMKDALDFLGKHKTPVIWGPLRHGIGHNLAAYIPDPDGNMIELFTELDIMNEELGYFEPKAWHHEYPQKPKVWTDEALATSLWGIKPPQGVLE
ncbi:VOC family protein [Priestia megaterium]|uniref:VOC family protein n=1 Tax=Priestia megaterium TaxID=1404 RepID=UPI000BF71FA5|nr:VOC family protein [Priestia megaterium]PFK67943.1 glyoxalase [Priestia megaterium]RFB19490.1 glyoxalase [Bacillus sp. ALD]